MFSSIFPVCGAFCGLAARNRDLAGVAAEVSGAFCDLVAKEREFRREIVFVVGAAIRQPCPNM